MVRVRQAMWCSIALREPRPSRGLHSPASRVDLPGAGFTTNSDFGQHNQFVVQNDMITSADFVVETSNTGLSPEFFMLGFGAEFLEFQLGGLACVAARLLAARESSSGRNDGHFVLRDVLQHLPSDAQMPHDEFGRRVCDPVR
jgi:hypothetical protein